MGYKQYPKDGGEGFSADEIKRGVHTLYADYECPECGRVQPVAAGQICQKCEHDFR